LRCTLHSSRLPWVRWQPTQRAPVTVERGFPWTDGGPTCRAGEAGVRRDGFFTQPSAPPRSSPPSAKVRAFIRRVAATRHQIITPSPVFSCGTPVGTTLTAIRMDARRLARLSSRSLASVQIPLYLGSRGYFAWLLRRPRAHRDVAAHSVARPRQDTSAESSLARAGHARGVCEIEPSHVTPPCTVRSG
jgi:hypothetical protein